MTQPFVISMKLALDPSQFKAGVQTAKGEIQSLAQIASERLNGKALTPGIFEAEVKALEDLKSKYVPLFAVERQHQANLTEIRNARAMGVLTTEEASNAIQRETAAYHAATAALQGHTAATQLNNRANAQRTNLLFQLQDIGVSLASGMNPLMVAAQQGSQVAMIYGPNEGGLGRALSETAKIAGGFATKVWPIALAVGAASAAVAGMRHEIEETSGVAVGFGDTLLAVFQVTGAALYDQFRPQVEAIKGWFGDAWDWVVGATKDAGNWIIRHIVGAIEYIKTSVGTLPLAFQVAGQAAAQALADAISVGVNSAVGNINGIIVAINDLAKTEVFSPFAPVEFKVDFGGADALASYEEAWKSYAATVDAISQRDFMGEFFGAVQQQAMANYNAGLEQTAKAAAGAAKGLEIAKQAASDLDREIEFYRSTFSGFFTDMYKGLREGGNAWEVFGNAAVSALDRIAERAAASQADGHWDIPGGFEVTP